MFRPGPGIPALICCCFTSYACAAALPACTEGARTSLPCEFTFAYNAGNLSPFKDVLLSAEFRSPSASTIRILAFPSGTGTLRIRFTPTEPGTWTYRTTSLIPALDNKESTFSVGDSGLPGMVAVANLRHWRTGKKQPHLWMSAEAPFLSLDVAMLEPWLDARKRDGFTHIRGPLLSASAQWKPLTSTGEPNDAYFDALDQRILAIATRGFVLDLLLADESMPQQIPEHMLRYLVARYGSFNVTWHGLQHFDDHPGSREQLRILGTQLKKYDGYAHPRSTDARVSSSPLLNDGWMNFLIEASPHPEVGAVEHQFTQKPQIHIVTATDPAAFRRELWSATTSGEYPTISYAALQNADNLKALATWKNILSNTRHWELEPYFDVSGASAAGLQEVEYLAYAPAGGIVEITVPKHKYNPQWVNPATGEEIPLKDYRGETFSRPTPDNVHDWILQVPREGKKESMLKYYYFESVDAPVQEAETDSTKIPFQIVEPSGEELNSRIPVPFKTKITRANRASRTMQYLWWGDVVSGGEGPRLLGVGSSGNLTIPPYLIKEPGSSLNLRIQAINANGKAYEVDKVYRLVP